MTQLSAVLRLRPIRIGFLVDPADLGSLRQIMRVCSCLWGGLYNPIIPVSKTLPEIWTRPLPALAPTSIQLAKGYIEFFEPDVYVQATPGLAAELGIPDVEIEIGTQRTSNLAELEGDPDSNDPRFGLSVLGAYMELFDREFRFVPRHPSRVALFKQGSTEEDCFIECTFGAFPQGEGKLADLAREYRDVFQPEELEPTADNAIRIFQQRYRFPLFFTRHAIERQPHGAQWWREPTLFVFDPASGCDLIDFWNLRLFRRNVLPVNVRWLEACAPFMRDLIARNYRPLPHNPHGVMMHTTVEFGRSIPEATAEELARKYLDGLPQGSWTFKLWYDRIWAKAPDEDQIAQPRRAQFSVSSRELKLTVSEEQRERSVTFDSLAPDFGPTYHRGHLGWVNVLRFRHFRSTADWLLHFPKDLNPARARYLRLGDSVLPSREGLVLPQHYRMHGEYIRIRTGRDAMIDWLKQHGVDAEISSSGRVTEQVIDSLDGLWGSRLLADRATLELLDNMAKSVRKFQDGTVEEYPDRTASAEQWTALIARRRQDIWSQNIQLDSFINAGVLRLGLLVQCDHCTYSNWIGISGLEETLTCERCRKRYPFPQGRLNFVHSPWRFRVVGPFAVPDYANGAYATALTLRVFGETLASRDATLTYAPGLIFEVQGKKPFEVDFSFWFSRDNWNEEQEVVSVFGEAKSFGEKCFTSSDIERMRQVAELFPGAFLVFAALKDTLHADEIPLISELAQWGRELLDDGRPRAPVIVLMGVELFAPWQVDHVWKECAGLRKQFAQNTRLDNLWILADVTQQVYLMLPSRFEEMRRKWEAARRTGQSPGASKSS
jgi:hypothetical protein